MRGRPRTTTGSFSSFFSTSTSSRRSSPSTGSAVQLYAYVGSYTMSVCLLSLNGLLQLYAYVEVCVRAYAYVYV
jgi:hypothetical protein